jgi:hypothetical protein
MEEVAVRPDAPAPDACAQCGKALSPNDRVEAGDRSFCRACYESLTEQLRRSITAITTDINYPLAAIGAALGGAAGIALWWGITVLTNVAFGLVAVAIGWLVAQGAVRLAGNKRSRGLQVLAIVVSIVSFAVASYLVNTTFINRELERRGTVERLPFVPPSLPTFIAVVSLGFGVMDLVFLGIMMWQAWSIPRAPKFPQKARA